MFCRQMGWLATAYTAFLVQVPSISISTQLSSLHKILYVSYISIKTGGVYGIFARCGGKINRSDRSEKFWGYPPLREFKQQNWSAICGYPPPPTLWRGLPPTPQGVGNSGGRYWISFPLPFRRPCSRWQHEKIISLTWPGTFISFLLRKVLHGIISLQGSCLHLDQSSNSKRENIYICYRSNAHTVHIVYLTNYFDGAALHEELLLVLDHHWLRAHWTHRRCKVF